MIANSIPPYRGSLMVMGDFNQVLFHDEKLSSSKSAIKGMDWLDHFVNLFCLRDVPNVGVKFTWASNRSDGLVTYECLDRAMSNLEWI